MQTPGWLARCVGAALAVQLVAAAGAVAGPWAVAPAGPPAPAAAPVPVGAPLSAAAGRGALPGTARAVPPVPASAAPAPVEAAAPVLLSAPGLWRGAVPLAPLGTDRDGALEVPATAGGLGWWEAGPRPGDEGAAIVVGHVDLDGRPGVFSRLALARTGDEVVVLRDGQPQRFRVVERRQFAKDAFPSDEVYAPSAQAELRLITCGGRFDRRTGHYEDNVVVRAVRVP